MSKRFVSLEHKASIIKVMVCILRDGMQLRMDEVMPEFCYTWRVMKRETEESLMEREGALKDDVLSNGNS